jgi:hydrogenase nickel incorporation protein HypA/HybF
VHELSLSSAIVATVERHAAGRRVSLVTLTVGGLRQVVPETLEFYFAFVARGSVCEGARLEIELLEPRLRCERCEREWRLEDPSFRCATCGEAEVAIVAGNEFQVESIEVEEAACIARR